MIEIINLTKSFKKNIVLDNINLVFDSGMIHGLVGRNGSGKTVLMKCICGLMQPTGGSITIDGKQIGRDIDFIDNAGILIEQTGFIRSESGYRNLCRLAMIRKRITKEAVHEVLEQVGLGRAALKKVKTYSLGMRQRLGIAQAIMEKPELLILDEPFNGLDKKGVDDMKHLFLQMKAEKKTILMASHYHEDIEELCDTVTELDEGKAFFSRNNVPFVR